jgi:hypothetical protein
MDFSNYAYPSKMIFKSKTSKNVVGVITYGKEKVHNENNRGNKNRRSSHHTLSCIVVSFEGKLS